MDLLTTTYCDKISGTLSCLDRVIITGTVPHLCYPQGMTSYLYSQGIRIFYYAKFAEPYRAELRSNAEQIAKENNIEIEFVSKFPYEKKYTLFPYSEYPQYRINFFCVNCIFVFLGWEEIFYMIERKTHRSLACGM